MASGKAGGTWTHSWTYQGYRVHGGRYRRSPGLQAEEGYVDLDYTDLKKLTVNAGPFWAGGGAGPKDIKAASARGGGPGQTTTAGGGGGGGGGRGGLKHFGDLVMQSSFKGTAMPAMVYKNIFVAPSGTEELAVGISDARAHDKGKVRVQLTDIRSTYEHGAFFGRINCRMPSGKSDYSTTRDGKGRLWTAIEVFIHLFSELPGSPKIHGDSVIYAAQFQGHAPADLVGEGEPIRDVLEQLLRRYGLVARLLPDNNYLLTRELGGDLSVGDYAEDVGSPATAEHIREERKAVSYSTTRAAAVLVVGKKRVRSTTMPYIPVIQDPKSGKIFPMNDVNCKRLGSSLADVNREVFVNAERSFRSVEPKNTKQGFLRAEMFRDWAYRKYAPAAAFDPDKHYSNGLLLEEFGDLPFMPMREAAWLKSDLAVHGINPKPKKTSGSGVLGEWILHPPVVWASRFRQGFFKDFDAIKDYFDMLMAGAKEAQGYIDSQIEQFAQDLKQLGPSLGKADREMQKRFSVGEATSKYGYLGSMLGIGMNSDSSQAGKEFGGGADAQALSAAMNAKANDVFIQEQIIKGGLEAWKSLVGKHLAESRKWKNEFKKFEDVYKQFQGVECWANFPHGPVEGGYSLDSETGLLSFHALACLAEQPFLPQPEGAVAAMDAAVMVNFGYEINHNILSDFTSVLFVAEDDPNADVSDGPSPLPGVKVAGLCRSSAIKPRVEKDPNIRLYENSAGEPFNVTEVISAAAARAAGQLHTPRAAVGYTYVVQGLRKAVLDDGVTGVQHEWDGKRAATHIMVNAPGSRGPLGAPDLSTRRGSSVAADRRDDIGRSEEVR